MSFLKKIFKPRKKNYVSPEDQFIQELFNKFPQQSNSQQFEINRANRVAYLRDNILEKEQDSVIWDKF